jgi:hypothetical protein
MANFPIKRVERNLWLDNNDTDSNHLTSSEDEDWLEAPSRKRIHTGNPKTPGEPRTSTWPSKVLLPLDVPTQNNGEDRSKNPPASNRIKEIIADHKNSMNPDQTVRPARSTTPLFGPIAYRVIPIIKNDQYLKPYIEQGPDLKNRLTIVLEFMNNPEVILDPLKVPIQLDNVWLNSAKELHIKKLNRFTLTATEETFLKKYKGFMYAKFLKDFHRVIVGRRYQSTMVTSELFIHQTWMSSHLRYCIYCTVIHPYREKDHPQKCAEIATNGPRQISDLLQTNVWRVNAMAYFMGHANLPYLPPSLRNVLINVGSGLSYDYMVPANAEEINGAEITHHQSLIHRINNVQHLAGKDSKAPILVEFFENPRYPGLPVEMHLAGFAKAVKFCQNYYLGPIIVIIPPAIASVNETLASYQIKIDRLTILQQYAHVLGMAIGTPIIHMPMQGTEKSETGMTLHYLHWIPEPIFSTSGNFTREFMSRMLRWLELLTRFMTHAATNTKPYGAVPAQ